MRLPSSSSSPSKLHLYEDIKKAIKIARSSIHAFLATYHTFASIATALVFPASAATLLSKSLPTFLQLFPLQKLNFLVNFHANISQSILSFLITLPFTLTFLCLAKASIIQAAAHILVGRPQTPPPLSPFLHLYRRLALTQLFNALLILSLNAIFLSTAFLTLPALSFLKLGLGGIIMIVYSTINANAFVVCNLASIIAATERCSSYAAILTAVELARERALVALLLALPANLGLTAIEAVFQVRVTWPCRADKKFDLSLMWEGLTIIYMHSIFTVLDIIITCFFYKCSKYGLLDGDEIGEEDGEGEGC